MYQTYWPLEQAESDFGDHCGGTDRINGPFLVGALLICPGQHF
jgi:hypothetical protein